MFQGTHQAGTGARGVLIVTALAGRFQAPYTLNSGDKKGGAFNEDAKD